MLHVPVAAKAIGALVALGAIALVASKASAKTKQEPGTRPGQLGQGTLETQAIIAAQKQQASALQQLAAQFTGRPEQAFVGGVANRLNTKQTGTSFGNPAQGKIFDPGPDLSRGGSLNGQNSSMPLRELQGLLLTFLGDGPSLVAWSMAMGALGFTAYAKQLADKAAIGSGKADGGGVLPAPSPSTPTGNDLGARVAAAIASHDPTIVLALADELAREGVDPAVVANLRTIGNELQAAAKAAADAAAKQQQAGADVPPPSPVVPPFVPIPTPGPSPSPSPAPTPTPSSRVARRYLVKEGDNPSKIAAHLTGNGNRFRELVAVNVPPKTRDKKSGGFTKLFAGEQLVVPPSWPEHPEAVPVVGPGPSPAPQPSPLPAPPGPVLDARTALAVAVNDMLHATGVPAKGRGHEDQNLVRQFQAQEGATTDGKYGVTDATNLAVRYNLIPQRPYWYPKQGAQSRKNQFIATMQEKARQDPARAAQWLEAAKVQAD